MLEHRSLKTRIDEYGYAFPLDAITAVEAADAREQVLRHLEKSERIGGLPARFPFAPKVHLLATWADALVRDARILNMVADVIGSNILCWGTNIFMKDPNDSVDLAWHQDALTYHLEGQETSAVRVWIALTEANPQNGTLQFAAGTHRGGIQPHIRASTIDPVRGDELLIDPNQVVCEYVNLLPGQCSVHNMLVAHKSGLNSSPNLRVNFAIDYVSTTVKPSPGDPDSATLVAGVDNYGHFLLEESPAISYDTKAKIEFDRAIRLRTRRLVVAAASNLQTGLLK